MSLNILCTSCRWPSESKGEKPFLDFLVSSCQFTGLSAYASTLQNVFQDLNPELLIRQKFFNGVSDLFIRNPEKALGKFLSITPQELVDSPSFSARYLRAPIPTTSLSTVFYEKVWER